MTAENNKAADQQFAAAAQQPAPGVLSGIKKWLREIGSSDHATASHQYGNSNERADRVNHPASEL